MTVAPLYTVALQFEHDVVVARQRARQIAGLFGFEPQEQTRLATAVSEIARNAVRYAGGGTVTFLLEQAGVGQSLVVRVTDVGPGIPHLEEVFAGRYRSQTGLGMGLSGARRLVDRFEIDAKGPGTRVELAKQFPRGSARVAPDRIAGVAAELARSRPESPFEELEHQNRELMRALEELRARCDELERLRAELEDTNRGVVALYAELDEKAESLRRASEVKTRFLSNMSHEFRTPLNAIRSLTGLLIDRVDGELTAEQEKQVGFIRRSAEELSELVNDLLDISKVEAGKVDMKVSEFSVADLFGALRGMLRPIAAERPSVALEFQEPEGVPLLATDEGKLSQILRNLISNALKFTERGEVRVSARMVDGWRVELAVTDTGIGIPAEHLERIFEEFEQVENELQSRANGTGLGLPLSRRLALLLGGTLTVESEPGRGSTFRATIPAAYVGAGPEPPPADEWVPKAPNAGAPGPLLVVDDDEVERYVVRDLLEGAPFELVEAADGETGLRLAREIAPRAILLDLSMPGMQGEEVLEALRADPATAGIPVLVYTSKDLSEAERRRLLGPAVAILAKGGLSRAGASAALRGALASLGVGLGNGVESERD